MPKRSRSKSVTIIQKNTIQTSFTTFNEKLPIVRIIFKHSELFQKTFNVVTVHNLIFLGEIWKEFLMTFPVKGDESTRFKRFFSLTLEASSSEDSIERFKSLAKSFSSPWEKSCEDKRDGGKSLSARVLSLSIEMSSSSLEIEDSSCGKP